MFWCEWAGILLHSANTTLKTQILWDDRVGDAGAVAGYGWTDGWMDGWTDGRMDGWTDGRMDGCMNARMYGWILGWMFVILTLFDDDHVFLFCCCLCSIACRCCMQVNATLTQLNIGYQDLLWGLRRLGGHVAGAMSIDLPALAHPRPCAMLVVLVAVGVWAVFVADDQHGWIYVSAK